MQIMTIITNEQIFDLVAQSRHLSAELYGALFNAAGENIVQYGQRTWFAAVHHDWNQLGVSAFLLICAILFGYRLIHKGKLRVLDYLSDNR